MALILISVQDTPEGPTVSVVAEPPIKGAIGGELTPAEQIADLMLRVLPRQEQSSVIVPSNTLIVPN